MRACLLQLTDVVAAARMAVFRDLFGFGIAEIADWRDADIRDIDLVFIDRRQAPEIPIARITPHLTLRFRNSTSWVRYLNAMSGGTISIILIDSHECWGNCEGDRSDLQLKDLIPVLHDLKKSAFDPNLSDAALEDIAGWLTKLTPEFAVFGLFARKGAIRTWDARPAGQCMAEIESWCRYYQLEDDEAQRARSCGRAAFQLFSGALWGRALGQLSEA